ncbi:MAG: LysR substrate-binding domain-containing protein [Alphaproteobacteria bacterium]|nr:LysR substrate-binding domain-containing protein [Alphaproteobacteria bacterium]
MSEWLPPIQALRAVVAAVRCGGFQKAGEALGLSHGAVSHHVAQLEHLVGAKLFTRHRRGAAPTPAGEALARRVAPALEELRDAIAAARGEAGGAVTVTVTPALAQRWLVPRLATLYARTPGLDLRLSPTARLVDLELEGVDLAFRYGAGGWSGVEAEPVAEEWVFPVAAPHYRGGALPRTPAELASCTLIRNPRQPWEPWFEAAGVAGLRPAGPTVEDAGLALDLATRGDGVALARGLLAHGDVAAGRLRPLFDIAIQDRFAYWLALRPGAGARPQVRAVADWLREECRRAVAATAPGGGSP